MILKALDAVDGAIAWVEKLVVVLLVTVLVGLPLTQVILRIVGEGGLAWGHELVRLLVMWLAFLGATLATRERRHITIDLLDRAITPRVKAVFNLITQAVAAMVLLYLARTAWTFVGLQHEMGDKSPVLGIPEWLAVSIFPVALGVMSWRFVLGFIQDAVALRTGDFDYLAGPSSEGRLY